jgi:TolA-binding protein
MKKDNETTNFTQSDSPENNETISDQSPRPILSEVSCGICVYNKFIESNQNAKENASLGLKDKVTKLREEVNELEIIPKDLIKHLLVHMKKRLKIEEKKLERIEAGKGKGSTSSGLDEIPIEKEMIIFHLRKSAFVNNAAHYYFNKNNPLGLHLSEKQVPHVALMLSKNYKHEDGTLLSYRTTRDRLKEGFKMDEEGRNNEY